MKSSTPPNAATRSTNCSRVTISRRKTKKRYWAATRCAFTDRRYKDGVRSGLIYSLSRDAGEGYGEGRGNDRWNNSEGYSFSSSLVLRNDGSSTESIASMATASNVALIGRCTKTHGLPRDSSIARRKYSSINGPRIKANSIGAGSQPSLENT